MRGTPIFIGDEVSAAGFRLAGARIRVPSPGEESAALTWACEQADLVLLTAEIASSLPAEMLGGVLRSTRPLVLVVPDLRERLAPPDLAAALRHQLGVAE